MRLHHIGVACRDIHEEISNVKKIHNVKSQSAIFFDEEQNAHLCLLEIDGGNIELISGPQVETLLKRNISYYHLCYEVDDVYAEIDRLVLCDALLISAPKPAVLFNNRLVAFLNVSYGIIELLNSEK